MIKTFTEHDVLKFVYEKTSNPHLEKELMQNENLLNEFILLEQAKNLLDNLRLSPSNSVINSIISYASQKS